MSNQIKFTPEDIRRQQEQLLHRMGELGWVSGFGWNDTTGRLQIQWTDAGRRSLIPVRVALDSLGCIKADTLCALEGLLHGQFINPSV
jgi:hypothetical protein